MPKKKTEKEDPLRVFNINSAAKQQKKSKGDPLGKNFFPEKKSHKAEKTERGDPLVLPGMVCYAGKQEKNFLVQFARPNCAIWCNNIL